MARPRKATPLKVLSDVGAEEHNAVRGKIPESLTDVILQQLKPAVRTRIALRLIEIATTGREKESLTAIKEIFDRVEGRARQSSAPTTDKDSVLLELLAETYRDNKRLYSDDITVLGPGDYTTREDDIQESGD